MIEWEEIFDNNDNSIWEGNSPYHDNGVFFRWRLKQKLCNNKIEWHEDHDAVINCVGCGYWWTSLEEAKKECQKCHDNILIELENVL
jgi:hypothetical protein